MAYIPNEWKDQVVQRPKTYQMNNNDDGSVTLIDSFGLVTELGTPVNQDYMNHIEQGIAGCAIRYYSTTETFKDNEAVLNVNEEGNIELWKSLTDNNLGNPLTDETKWQKVDLGASTGSGFNMFDLVVKDHVLSFEESKGFAQLGTYVYKDAVPGSRYGYPDFYSECVSEKTAGTPTQTTLGDSTITTYNNANGHIFYDIADKSVVDAFYESLGVAWFYGVDTTNERIFLPRGKNYLAFTQNNIPVVGNGLSLGLMDGKGNNAGLAQIYSGGNLTEPISDAYGVEAGTDPGATIAFSPNVAYGVTDDAEKSGLVANTEDLFSNNPEAYIYMVVGNTEVESAATDITDITTTENDTIPLFAPWFFDFEPNSTAWLIAGGQKNNGGLYASTYATLVQELTNPKYNLKVIDVDDMESGLDYSLYWKVDQTNQTFTAPTRVSYAALSGKIMGNGMTLGLFNGSDNFGLSNSTYTTRLYPSSNTYGTDVGTAPSGSEGNMVSFGITTDPDKSGIEVEKVTSQLYFKVSNAVQNMQVINVGEITTALAGKVDNTNTEWAADVIIPNYTAGVSKPVKTNNTAECAGAVYASGNTQSAGTVGILRINGVAVGRVIPGDQTGNSSSCYALVNKGDIYNFDSSSINTPVLTFYPCKGASND